MPPKRHQTATVKSSGPSTDASIKGKGRASSSKISGSSTGRRRRADTELSTPDARQEAEIREAFELFAVQIPGFEDEDGGVGVIRAQDMRRCLIALDIPPTRSNPLPAILSIIDPSSTGYIPYPTFLEYAAIALEARQDEFLADEEAIDEEVQTAFNLFTKGRPGPITLQMLKRVAREIKEEVSEETLMAMLLEANGGSGMGDVRRGVGVEEFEGVMRRAGVFG